MKIKRDLVKKTHFFALFCIFLFLNGSSQIFSHKQLELFLDSVGKLSSDVLAKKVNHKSDSIFQSIKSINFSLTQQNFAILKSSIKDEYIDTQVAKKIDPSIKIDSAHTAISIVFYSFDNDTNEFKQFAICLGYREEIRDFDDVYFFESNKAIAKMSIERMTHQPILNYYRDTDGNAVIYRSQKFDGGSGVSWYNYYFYKYYQHKLIPALNIPEETNLSWGWGYRILSFKTLIEKTNPLTLKMLYRQSFSSSSPEACPLLLNDSVIVCYYWDETDNALKGNYSNEKMNADQLLTYYTNNNDILFTNLYYKLLKQLLNSKSLSNCVYEYLSAVKIYYKL